MLRTILYSLFVCVHRVSEESTMRESEYSYSAQIYSARLLRGSAQCICK